MLGVFPDGSEAEVDRAGRPTPHPLQHATIAEIRSTFVACLRGANRSWDDIARAMRCSPKTAQADKAVPALRLRPGGGFADAS